MITPPPSTMPVIFGKYFELWSELGLPDRMAPHELDNNVDNYKKVSQADMWRVVAYMAAGDRGAAYMRQSRGLAIMGSEYLIAFKYSDPVIVL